MKQVSITLFMVYHTYTIKTLYCDVDLQSTVDGKAKTEVRQEACKFCR